MLKFATIALGFTLGCGASTGTRALPRVAPPPADPEKECLRLGAVVGTADPFFGAMKKEAELVESARTEALTVGARAGATHVTFPSEPKRWPSGTFGGGQGVTVVGVAYDCGAGKHPSASTAGGVAPRADAALLPAAGAGGAGGCTRDTDCKGDRTCQAGSCADPVRRTETAGCSKDTDCKGDRICRAGACADPAAPPGKAPAP